MVKMVFSDFDNTMMYYYSDKNYFDEYQFKILKGIQDKEIKFCIVTGRSVSFFDRFPGLLDVVDYIIASNGACIYDVKMDNYIYQEVIDKDILNGLISFAKKNNHSFLLNCCHDRYYYGNWDNVHAFLYEDDRDYNCEQVVLSFFKIYKDEVANSIEYFKDIKVNNATDWDDKYSIDINNVSVSKGNAINWLCSELKIDKDDTIGFGDGVNDIPMFEVVGNSVAVGNANEKVKSYADDVTLDCGDYGIYKYMEENVLKR